MKHGSRTCLIMALHLAALGCGNELPRRGEVLLHVDTDAPLPKGDFELGVAEPPALFDTLRVDVFEPAGSEPCAGCSREFALDRVELARAAVSFSVLPEEGRSGSRARLRLFRTRFRRDGEPRADSTIDVTIALPAVDEGDLEEVTVFLATDDVAVPRGSLAQPVEPMPGPPAASSQARTDRGPPSPHR